VIGLLFGGSRGIVTLAVLGVLGWVGLAVIGVAMANAGPPGVGFDLALLLAAGRKAASGLSLYSAPLVGGATVQAQVLFYSYPPFVAQLIAPLSSLPLHVVLVGWSLAATGAFAAVSVILVRHFGPRGFDVATGTAVTAVGPLVAPYAIGMLFGNFNVFFPALYGLVLLAAARPHDRASRIAGGIALGVAAATKVHPASLALWFIFRGARERGSGDRPYAWTTLGIAIATGLVLVVGSLLVGGLQPWSDYIAVARASTGAELLDHRNYGPAAQLGLAVGLSETGVRIVHVGVATAAVGLTAWAAWRRRDPLESLALAALASLVMLPVTWIHYPAALLPFVLVALARDRSADRVGWVALAIGCAAASILLTPLLWVAVAIALGVVIQRRTIPASVSVPSSA
jgi:alpha-1,2-mannosyltransferase